MPWDKSRYPADWDAISARIKARADHRCEVCDAPDGQLVVRLKTDTSVWKLLSELDDWEISRWRSPVKIVLTTHHIGVPYDDGRPGNPHDKMDCRDVNLIALCNRCHLLADAEIHRAARKRTLQAKRETRLAVAGQLKLF